MKWNELGAALAAIVLWCVAAGPVMAGELPESRVPDSFGVNVSGHQIDEVDYAKMNELDVQWVRKGFLWTHLEKTKGEYDFSRADAFMNELEANGIGWFCVLAFGNKLYEPGQHWMGVRTPEGRAGFARYAAAMAERFKGRKVVFEIWNESNSSFWKPEPDAEQYMAMLDEAVAAMREADPDCVIVAPSLYHIGWPKAQKWFEQCLERDIHEKVDAFSFHSYGDRGRNYLVERNLGWAAEIRAMMAKHGAPEDFPFVQSEYGINQNAPEFRDQPEDQWQRLQAQSVTRNYLVMLMLEAPINIHYEWKSRSESTRGDKGLLNRDKTTTLAYDAFNVLTEKLEGCTFDRRVDGYADDDYVVAFTDEQGRARLAVWTTGEAHTVDIPIAGTNAVEMWSMTGQDRKVAVEGGRIKVELTNGPAYVHLGGGTVAD